jgi:pilus assembly protein CpaE
MSHLSLISLCPSTEFEEALTASGLIKVMNKVDSVDVLADSIASQRPDAVLVSLFEDSQRVLEELERVATPRPILFCLGPADSELILKAMRLGVYEYLAPGTDAPAQLVAAIECLVREQASSERGKKAPLIAVAGAKGGVGTSFIACQLSASLAQMGSRPVLVDGQLQLGDIALYLDLSPDHTFASLAKRDDVDSTCLRSMLAKHDSGIHVMATPQFPEEADSITVDCVARLRSLLQHEFDWVIWDTPQGFDERSLHILDHASTVVLVTTPDVPAMNHTRMQLDLLERLGRNPERTRVIVNRTDRSASVSERAAQQFLGRSVDVSIPNDYARASACVNEGRTLHDLAPRAAVTNAVGELARQAYTWSDQPVPEDKQAPAGFVGRLLGR